VEQGQVLTHWDSVKNSGSVEIGITLFESIPLRPVDQ
jgi:hypothetical protein